MNKRTTIKILRSGKINIDGGNSEEEAYELYHWLESIFVDFQASIVFDKSVVVEDSSDYDYGSGESIYDDDLTEPN
jgi:TATA-box binding protein (TBP) (component of TFIID and TFIIIB)